MGEPTHLIAIFLALGSAIALASQSLFIRIGTQRGKSLNAVFVVILVNLIVLFPLVSILYYPDYGLTHVSWLSFVVAGMFGTMLGRVLKFTSISRIGASRTEPITASNALFATVLGMVLLGETLTVIHGVGVVLIVVGVAAIAWETSHENPDDLPLRELAVGLLIPLGAALAYAIEPIFANFGFDEGTPALVGLLVKTVAASLAFTLYLRWRGSLPGPAELRSNDTRWFAFAGVANTVFLLGYYGALSIAPVSVVVPIIITSTLFVVILSALFMPQRLERVTWRLAMAAATVVIGVLVITILT